MFTHCMATGAECKGSKDMIMHTMQHMCNLHCYMPVLAFACWNRCGVQSSCSRLQPAAPVAE